MLRFIISMISFIKELVFENEEEYDFRSRNFNPKKWTLFLYFIVATLLTLGLTIRSFSLAAEVLILKEQLAVLEHKQMPPTR